MNLTEVVYCWLTEEELTLHFGEKYKRQGVECERWEFRRGGKVFNVPDNPALDLQGFQPLRLFQMIQRIQRRVALPLLSMPTHRQGWLDASTLIERTTLWLEAGEDIPVQEQVLALLRLATQTKANLQPLRKLSHPFAKALCLALGDDVSIPKEGEAAVWLAALLASQPSGKIDHLRSQVALLHKNTVEDAKKRYHLEYYFGGDDDDNGVASETLAFRALVNPFAWPVPRAVDAYDWIATLLFESKVQEFFLTREKAIDEGLFRWQPTTWPSGRQPWYAAKLHGLVDNLDWFEAQWQDVVLLEPLLHPDEPLVGSTLLTLAFTLTAKEPGQQRMATEVLIAGINDGRLDGASLGQALGQVLRFPRTKAARLVRSLGDAVQCGPLQQVVILQALEHAMVAPMPEPLRDLAALFEAWLEWATEAAVGVTEPTSRAILGGLSGGKLAKLAKQLLAVVEQPSSLLEAARYQAYQARVERAERWAAASR
jgi:hypothetical protein